jgi:hypothetical protein
LDDALDLDVTGRSTALKQLPDEEVNCMCARHSPVWSAASALHLASTAFDLGLADTLSLTGRLWQ